MKPTADPDPSSCQGLRVFTCGHSCHAFLTDILVELAKGAGIDGHRAVGTSRLGASRAIRHWNLPDKKNHAKAALRAGDVDVLTLSCMTYPDDGIGKFARLAVENNPAVRVTLQELWLPEDRFPFDWENPVRQSVEEFNDVTMEDLKKPHEAYFRAMEDYVSNLNAALGRQVVFIVPDAQATLALRRHIIAGTAPGLTDQSDLFTDAWGHPTPPLQLLSTLCHFSVIYRRSPSEGSLPSALKDDPAWGEELNHLLQRLAWDAVTEHPMSGVSASITEHEAAAGE